MTIQPGETFAYHIELDVKGTGQFESAIRIFLEDNGIRQVDISVTGTAVEKQE